MRLVGQLRLPPWKQLAGPYNDHKIHKYDEAICESHNWGIRHYESTSKHGARGACLFVTLMFFSLEQPFS
jgi:hypothetical protein